MCKLRVSLSLTEVSSVPFCSRYFVLDTDCGQLRYFISEPEAGQKARGSLPLPGATVRPSDEAPYTFTVLSAAGNLYKLRGTHRQAPPIARPGDLCLTPCKWVWLKISSVLLKCKSP